MLEKEVPCDRLPKWEPPLIEKLQKFSTFEMHNKDSYIKPYPSRSESKTQIDTWSLVLTARGVPHKILQSGQEYWIEVAPGYEDLAASEVEKYEEENRTWPPKYEVAPSYSNAWSTFWTLVILTAIFNCSFLEDWRGQLFAVGSGDVDHILHGQWWRLITALTLHSNPPHLLGNMIIGGFIMIWLCGLLGTGLGWGLTLLSGISGNLMNALMHGGSHNSIGSSTAVFGALGIIIGFQALAIEHFRPRDRLIPIGAGLALLGFMGTSGRHTDLGAHLFGFLSGIILGLLTGQLVKTFGLPCHKIDRIIGAITCLVPILAWLMAFC